MERVFVENRERALLLVVWDVSSKDESENRPGFLYVCRLMIDKVKRKEERGTMKRRKGDRSSYTIRLPIKPLTTQPTWLKFSTCRTRALGPTSSAEPTPPFRSRFLDSTISPANSLGKICPAHEAPSTIGTHQHTPCNTSHEIPQSPGVPENLHSLNHHPFDKKKRGQESFGRYLGSFPIP